MSFAARLIRTVTAGSSSLHVYSSAGSGVEVVPNDTCTSVVIEAWGAAGAGGPGLYGAGGAGGGSGGYCKKTVALSSDGGKTINYTVGADDGADTSVSSGTLTVGTLTAGTAGDGSIGTYTFDGNDYDYSLPGAGGAASGGDTNTTGSYGYAGSSAAGGAGGPGTVGTNGVGADGGIGQYGSQSAGAGHDGLVIFSYS